jgi:hypothetical protein
MERKGGGATGRDERSRGKGRKSGGGCEKMMRGREKEGGVRLLNVI